MNTPDLEKQRYEKQGTPGRRCGAAALVMVYRAWNIHVTQEHVWQELCQDAKGLATDSAIRTLHLARHATRSGLCAVACRMKKPWEFLTRYFAAQHVTGCARTDSQIILNHRLSLDSVKGHFTVPVAFQSHEKKLTVHDPQFGAFLPKTKSEMLELWQPKTDHLGNTIPGNEITGNIVLIVSGVTARSDTNVHKSFLGSPISLTKQCTRCGETFGLPGFLSENRGLFCRFFCPACDSPEFF